MFQANAVLPSSLLFVKTHNMTCTHFSVARAWFARALCLAAGLLFPPSNHAQQAKEFNFKLDLDTLFSSASEPWALTQDKLEEMCTQKGFKTSPYVKWLNQARDSARFSKHPFNNVSLEMTIFGGAVYVDEMVIEFKDGKASLATISLYNRGDSGKISKTDFEARYKQAGMALGKWLAVRPVERRSNSETSAIKTSGWLWTSPATLALLEYNTDGIAKADAAEFMRLKLSPASQKDKLLNIAAIGRGSTALKRSELVKFVKKESNGDVYVSGVPMVDQGDKGYCVAATCQRMFGYLHIPCDQNEIAALAGTSAKGGTSSIAFEETLKKVDNRFKTRFKALLQKRPMTASPDKNARPDNFLKLIQSHIDKGVPLLWGLEVGLVQEDPPLKMQGTGGHMRLIIGYNVAQNQLLFTDSWGQGHELKRVKLEDAIKATFGVYLLEPRDF